MTVDHTKDTIAGITGFTPEQVKEFSEKAAETITQLHCQDKISLSYFMEELIKNYSYSELIILASQALEMHYKKSVLYSMDKIKEGRKG